MVHSIFSRDIRLDGAKNVAVALSGTLFKDLAPTEFLLFNELSLSPRAVRIESVVFAIQEKMGFNLLWKMEGGQWRLILPLESRGRLDFESPMQGIHSPEGAIGLGISSFLCVLEKTFLVMLDLTKQ